MDDLHARIRWLEMKAQEAADMAAPLVEDPEMADAVDKLFALQQDYLSEAAKLERKLRVN